MNIILKIAAAFGACVLLVTMSCSTEKNTFMSRSFNSVNARYNGLFNANELLRLSMDGYRANLDESYYDLVAIDPVPSETEVEAYYSPIDTAIAKCTKVIIDHSMPSNERPSKKNAEHNNWIDENWITIGKASFYRRDYEGAMKNFVFIKKFFENDPSNYIGELWMAKTNLKLGQLTEAKFNLDNLDKALEEHKSGEANKKSEEKTKKTKTKSKAAAQNNKKSSSKEKEDKKAKFPKKILFDFNKTKADYAIATGDKPKAIGFLEESLKHGKVSSEIGRVHFVLAQLYEEQGNRSEAAKHYKKARKENIPFKMAFTARMKYSMLNNDGKQRKQLQKMLRDAKNAEFKDQIYYALAQVELNEGNEDLTVEYLTESAFYSTTNKRQKGMAYEQLGNLRFAKRDYIRAQKYYDSCAVVIDDKYPNAEGIRNKASNLADLVVAVETVNREDSLQRIAKMDPSAQETFLKNLIKTTKEQEEARKKREAEKLRALNPSIGVADGGGNGNKFYWNNTKTIADGKDEFVKLWGTRKNEDDWRRSQKTQSANFVEEETDSTVIGDQDSLAVADTPEDTLTVDYLSSKLPKTEEDFAASNQRLMEALYNAGVIYKEQLNEKDLAKGQFNRLIDKNLESKYNVMSAFQLYKLNETNDPTAAANNKGYILDNYPNSDYANFLRDPDYFIKKKERDALAEEEYVRVLDRYSRKVYGPVVAKAEEVIANEPDNVYRAKYMLLHAMCQGQTTDDKKELLPMLNRIKAEYPASTEAARAQEMIDIINNGYSVNVPVNFDKKFDFVYEEDKPQLVLIFLEEKDNPDLAKNKISDFNKEFFPKSKIKVSSKIYNTVQSVIALQEFANEKEAKDYVRKYKETRKYLLDLQKAKIVIISAKNMKTLFEKNDLQQYELFYDEFY